MFETFFLALFGYLSQRIPVKTMMLYRLRIRLCEAYDTPVADGEAHVDERGRLVVGTSSFDPSTWTNGELEMPDPELFLEVRADDGASHIDLDLWLPETRDLRSLDVDRRKGDGYSGTDPWAWDAEVTSRRQLPVRNAARGFEAVRRHLWDFVNG